MKIPFFSNLFAKQENTGSPMNPYLFSWQTTDIKSYPSVYEARECVINIHQNPQDFMDWSGRVRRADLDLTADLSTRIRALSNINLKVEFDDSLSQDKRTEFIEKQMIIWKKRIVKIAQSALIHGHQPTEFDVTTKNNRIVYSAFNNLPFVNFSLLNGEICKVSNVYMPFNTREALNDFERFKLICPRFELFDEDKDEKRLGGLMKYALINSAMTGFSIKVWLQYAETYGKPMRFGKYKPNHKDADITRIKDAVNKLGTDLSGVIPFDSEIQLLESAQKSGSNDLFATLAVMFRNRQSKLILGNPEITNNAEYGTRAKADKTELLRLDVMMDDMDRVNQTLTEAGQKLWVMNFDQNTPFQDVPLKVELNYEPPKDLLTRAQIIKTLSSIPNAGKRIPAAIINKDFDIDIPTDGEDTLESTNNNFLG